MDDGVEARIIEKAEYIEEAVAVLSRKRSLNEKRYHADREQRAIVEREFQTTIEACIDIARLILKHADRSVPDANAATFKALGEIGVLSADTTEKMEETAGPKRPLTQMRV